MSTHANDWLGNWEHWEYWDYWELREFFCAGVRGEWLSVDFRFPPLIPVPFRFFRQSRNANDWLGNWESPMSNENSSAVCKKKTLTTFCYQRFQGKKNGVRSRTRTYDLHDVNVAL